MLFVPAAPVIGKLRLLVRLITRSCPEGTVITTGDQVFEPIVAGFSGLQVVFGVMPPTRPQKYPHIGTVEPSGNVTVVGIAVRFTWARERLAPRRRTDIARTAVFKVLR
jgi:hypothetical protein